MSSGVKEGHQIHSPDFAAGRRSAQPRDRKRTTIDDLARSYLVHVPPSSARDKPMQIY